MNTMQHPDVVIAGAGVLGLSLALELQQRGRTVLIQDRNAPGLASRAAAGMLAAHDPHNPPPLQPLADLALDLYPDYLARIREGSGHPVPIQTEHILEAVSSTPPSAGSAPNVTALPSTECKPGHTCLSALSPAAGNFILRPEQSLDPRDLHTALRAAVEHAGIRVAREAQARQLHIDCTGAWSPIHTRPAKGQMLRVQLPPDTLKLPHGGNAVVRTEHIYLVPRLDGSTLLGATVEDAGFDLTTEDEAMQHLRDLAASLIPAAADAPELERWSGLRPRTADELPILGAIAPDRYVANGLFRNGILLAPAVARVMAELLTGQPTTVPLAPFSPHRPTLT